MMKDDEETSAVSPSVAINLARLLSADWPDRWALLHADPRLLVSAVAERCKDQDPLLQMMIERSMAAGLPQAEEEFPLAAILSRCVLVAAEPDIAEAINYVISIVSIVNTNTELLWLAPLLIAAFEHLAPHAEGEEFLTLQAAHSLFWATAYSIDVDAIDEIHQLVESTAAVVWTRLAQMEDYATPAAAAEIFEHHLRVFAFGDEAIRRTRDIRELLKAASVLGPQAAQDLHELVLKGRFLLEAVEQPHRLEYLCSLVNHLVQYPDVPGSTWAEEMAYDCARRSLESASPGHPLRAMCASNLGTTIRNAVERGLLDQSAMGEAVALQREAVAATGTTDSARPWRLHSLALSLAELSNNEGEASANLSEAIRVEREALELSGPGVPEIRLTLIRTLANLISRAVVRGALAATALEESIGLGRELVASYNSNAVERARAMALLALHIDQAIVSGALETEAFEEAIGIQRQALELLDPSSPDLGTNLEMLASILGHAARAGWLAAKVAHSEALSLLAQAMDIPTSSDEVKVSRTRAFVAAMRESVQDGSLQPVALVMALNMVQDQVANLSTGVSRWRVDMLSALAALMGDSVYAGLLDASYIHEAIRLQDEALLDDHPARYHSRITALNNAAALRTSGMTMGTLTHEVLPEAISCAREALRLTQRIGDGVPSDTRAAILSNLAHCLELISDPNEAEIVDEIIALHREALAVSPIGSVWRHSHESHLSMSIVMKMFLTAEWDQTAMDEAMSIQRRVLAGTPPGHPDFAGYLTRMGTWLEDAIDAEFMSYHEAAPEILMMIDGLWAHLRSHSSSPRERRRALENAEWLVSHGVEIVLKGLGPEPAIECVEAVRNHLSDGIRTSSRRLTGIPTALARSFERTARQYDEAQQRDAEGFEDPLRTADISNRLRRLVDEIRLVPGQEWFGSRPRFEDLYEQLPSQLVAVYLLPGKNSGSAIVLGIDANAQVVDLPLFTRNAANNLADGLLAIPAYAQEVCAWLWHNVMQHLSAIIPPGVDWLLVPTGPSAMLPIHAAGVHDEGWLDDIASVQVLPCVSMLSVHEEVEANGSGLVALSDAGDLLFTQGDMAVARYFQPSSRLLLGSDSRREAVLSALVEAPSAIISSHAARDTNSGGVMMFGKEQFTTSDIDTLPSRRRKLAILSCCSSGQVADCLLDESIGLPNALLHVGFRGVLATMWPLRDLVAFITVARLLHLDSPEAPSTQLRVVRRWLRDATAQELSEWLAELHDLVQLPQQVRLHLDNWLVAFGAKARPLADPADWGAFAYIGR